MTQQEYLSRFVKETDAMYSITRHKNVDYAKDSDAFANFRAIENLTNGMISMEAGTLTRMSDKFVRLCNLMSRDVGSHKVVDESITDTLQDLAVYAVILKIMLEEKYGPAREVPKLRPNDRK